MMVSCWVGSSELYAAVHAECATAGSYAQSAKKPTLTDTKPTLLDSNRPDQTRTDKMAYVIAAGVGGDGDRQLNDAKDSDKHKVLQGKAAFTVSHR